MALASRSHFLFHARVHSAKLVLCRAAAQQAAMPSFRAVRAAELKRWAPEEVSHEHNLRIPSGDLVRFRCHHAHPLQWHSFLYRPLLAVDKGA